MVHHRSSNQHLVSSLRENRGGGTPMRRRGGGTPLRRRGAGTPLFVPYLSGYARNRGGGFLSGVLKKAGKLGGRLVKRGVKRAASTAKRVVKKQGSALAKKATAMAKRKGSGLAKRATRAAKGQLAQLGKQSSSPLGKITAAKIKKAAVATTQHLTSGKPLSKGFINSLFTHGTVT